MKTSTCAVPAVSCVSSVPAVSSVSGVSTVPIVRTVSVFSKTSTPLPKYLNNCFNGNTTNFGCKALQPSFDSKTIVDNTNNKYRINMPM